MADSDYILGNLLNLVLHKIAVPTEFHAKVSAIKSMLSNDVTGLIDSLTDFAVDSANVDFEIETKNEKFTEILNTWMDEVNSGYEGEVPSGIKALSKEYYKERWKYSSFPVLKIAEWGSIEGVLVPTKMFFVKGESIYAKEKDTKSKSVKLNNWDYFLGKEEEEPLNKNVILTKPFGRWFDKYPDTYLIKRGIYNNYLIFKSIKDKESSILDQIIPYLLLIKKGTEGLATQHIKTYSNPELQAIIDQFKKLIDDMKTNNSDYKSVESPVRASQFDEEIKHLIPDLSTIFDPKLFEEAERNILSGLGFIDVVQGISSSRRESVLNPRVFMRETIDGVEGFKQILKELIFMIKRKNSSHRKYTNVKCHIMASAVKAFMTDDFKAVIRQAYDRGALSIKTYVDLGAEADFETEKIRREREAKNGVESLFYPHLTRNDEEKGIDLPPGQVEPTNDEDEIPEDKTNEIEKQNYDIGGKYSCECIKCGHKISTNQHCKEVICPKCGGTVRRINRPGQGQPNNSELLTSPYSKPANLPPKVKKNISSDLQPVFIRVFNNAFQQYNNEIRAFRVAWSVIRQIGRKNSKGLWVRKKQRIKGKLTPVKLSKEVIMEALEEVENEIIDETMKEQKIALMEKQSLIADILLKNSKEK